MLLAIDIGNTTIKFGVFDRENLIRKFTIPTVRRQTADEIDSLINSRLPRTISSVIVSSVVPEIKKSIEEFIENRFGISPLFVGHNFNFGLKIKYSPPEAVGIDRIVAALAAAEKYGKPCIICDFGTATTVDAVNSKGEFLGGVIVAGMKLLADALSQRTSKLPKIEIKKMGKVIGNSTVEAIQSGIYFGYIGLTDGIIRQMIIELGENPKIIATGGFASIIADVSDFIEIYDENLMLDGLRRIFEKFRRESDL